MPSIVAHELDELNPESHLEHDKVIRNVAATIYGGAFNSSRNQLYFINDQVSRSRYDCVGCTFNVPCNVPQSGSSGQGTETAGQCHWRQVAYLQRQAPTAVHSKFVFGFTFCVQGFSSSVYVLQDCICYEVTFEQLG